MKPVFFPEQNRVLTGPGGIADEEIQPLPTRVENGICWSLWEPDEAERATITAGGYVLLGVMSGSSQPPVLVLASPGEAQR